MGWKKFAKKEKGVAGQVKSESHVDGFVDIKGVVHHEFLCQGQTVNWYYLEALKCLRENVRRKIPQLWRNNSRFLHHDNALAHALLMIRDFFGQHEHNCASQPPYSPVLALANFLFPKLKSILKGR
jgi:hypothetical protein